jgi:hypothetical protein
VTGGGRVLAHGVDEGVDLGLEGVGLGHLALLEGERGLAVRARLAAADADAPLVVVTDR